MLRSIILSIRSILCAIQRDTPFEAVAQPGQQLVLRKAGMLRRIGQVIGLSLIHI